MTLPVLDILKHFGIDSKKVNANNVACLCPYHDDTNPSCHVEINTGVFYCKSCLTKGDLYKLLSKSQKQSKSEIVKTIERQFNVSDDRIIKPAVVDRYHRAIAKRPDFLEALYYRGVTPSLIEYYKIGADKDRITIPIKNKWGHYTGIRRYKPGAKEFKVIALKYRGENRLFPIEQLEHDVVMLTGGELKAIVAAYYLNSFKIGAVTGTQGEAQLPINLAEQFEGKIVYVCMDVDEAGQKGANKVASAVSRFAKEVHICKLPLSIEQHPTGDINDYVRLNKDNLKCMYDVVMHHSDKFEIESIKKKELSNGEPMAIDLHQSVTGDHVGKRLSIDARVVALLDKPYEIPRKLKVQCEKSESFCTQCPVFFLKKDISCDIPDESRAIISMCGSHDSIQQDEIKASLDIPKRCKSCTFVVEDHYSVQEARISSTLKMTERVAHLGMQTAFCIGNSLEANREYTFVGRNYPHLRDQSASFIVSKYKPLEDELSNYKPKDTESLNVFQPKEWTSEEIIAKLHEIYKDLESNATYIYERRRIHLAVDFAYHSPLQFVLDRKLQKGWVETLIVGDSSIGKTETASQLREHYGLGKRTSCKGATVAGLVGGLQSINGRFFVTWGIVPTYDKQLVILEELSGARKGAIQGMTDMRTTGIAELTKIEKRSTHARTRLIALSNPVPGRNVGSYTFGIQAIQGLIPSPEDIRRFDFCLVESEEEISAEKITRLQAYRPNVEHVYTSHLCRDLILWIWSRNHEQVIFEKDAVDHLRVASADLCTKYSESCPIIDKGSTRYKVARLSASLAGRTFSHDKYGNLLVRKCHVEAVHTILDSTYSSTTIGYFAFSESIRYHNTIQDADVIEFQIRRLPSPKDFVSKLLHSTIINSKDIEDWTGFDSISARVIISLLVRKNAFQREGRDYKKNEEFNRMLARLLKHGDLPNEKTKLE